MGARWILAVDLGNGGPKVAVVSLEGEVRRVAMRPVHLNVGLDGTATQDATEWWSGLLEAHIQVHGAHRHAKDIALERNDRDLGPPVAEVDREDPARAHVRQPASPARPRASRRGS